MLESGDVQDNQYRPSRSNNRGAGQPDPGSLEGAVITVNSEGVLHRG